MSVECTFFLSNHMLPTSSNIDGFVKHIEAGHSVPVMAQSKIEEAYLRKRKIPGLIKVAIEAYIRREGSLVGPDHNTIWVTYMMTYHFDSEKHYNFFKVLDPNKWSAGMFSNDVAHPGSVIRKAEYVCYQR